MIYKTKENKYVGTYISISIVENVTGGDTLNITLNTFPYSYLEGHSVSEIIGLVISELETIKLMIEKDYGK